MLWGGGEDISSIGADVNRWSTPMQKLNDLSRCLTPLDPDSTLITVIEMSLSSWLVAGIVPGVERQPLKKLAVDESVLLKLLHCFEPRSALLGSGSPALCRDDFVVGTTAGADAIGRFFADFDIEILRSVSRRRAALPKPHLGDGAGGAGSRGALGARN